MPIPPLSHLQFAVLDCLHADKKSGRELRAMLAERRIRKSGPAFYQLMSRLEKAKFVKGWYDQKIVEGQIIKERNYRILANGVKARMATLEFYGALGQASSGPALARMLR